MRGQLRRRFDRPGPVEPSHFKILVNSLQFFKVFDLRSALPKFFDFCSEILLHNAIQISTSICSTSFSPNAGFSGVARSWVARIWQQSCSLLLVSPFHQLDH